MAMINKEALKPEKVNEPSNEVVKISEEVKQKEGLQTKAKEEQNAAEQKSKISNSSVKEKITLRVRTKPSVNSTVLELLEPFTKVDVLETIISEEQEWAKVRYSNGKQGYVMSKFLDLK